MSPFYPKLASVGRGSTFSIQVDSNDVKYNASVFETMLFGLLY